MSLLRKVRVLLGALAHKPFAPRPEKVDLDQEPGKSAEATKPQGAPGLESRDQGVAETERVADLIAQQQREDER
jgi:hypothetical protein